MNRPPSPLAGPGQGYHPSSPLTGMGYPSPGQDMARTGYAVGSTPLAVTLEDFLVEICKMEHAFLINNYRQNIFPVSQFFLCYKYIPFVSSFGKSQNQNQILFSLRRGYPG